MAPRISPRPNRTDTVWGAMGKTEYYLVSDDVLAEFRDKADEPEFWAAHWKSTDYERFLERYENGYLGEFTRVFQKYLPKDRLILEAGCGRGQHVYALQRLGYRVVGVDFSAELVMRAKKAKPEINVVVGDVRALDFEDRSLGAYISLGVVEHFWDGMGGILSEARRVLEDDGVLLLSVPHFSPPFKRRAGKSFPRASGKRSKSGQNFYQFYFTRAAIEKRLNENGFVPTDTFYYAGKYGATRASASFNALWDGSYVFRGVTNRIFRLPIPQVLLKHFAHMVLIVAVKNR